MLLELVQLAVGNLLRARGRLAMTASGVLVGTAAVVLLLAFTIGLQQAAESGIGSVASLTEVRVYPGFSPDPEAPSRQLDAEAIAQIQALPGVAAAVPVLTLQTRAALAVDDLRYYGQFLGIQPELLPYLGLRVAEGTPALGPGQAVVGADVASFFVDPEADSWEPQEVDIFAEPVELRVLSMATNREQRFDIDITARFAPASNNMDGIVILPLADVLALTEWSTGQAPDPEALTYDYLIVRATSRETTRAVSEAIRELGYGTGGVGEFLDQLNRFFLTMRLMLGGIGGVALVVAAFGVANTMMMAILERTREIGLMKALGARDRDVLIVFLIEAGLVGLVGGLAGVLAAYALQDAVNRALREAPSGGVGFLPFDLSQMGDQLLVIPPELAIFAVGLAVLVGLGAGVLPAIRAARLPPVTALQME
ncbi:MAG: ABC transporter permease [Anaerolineae bacterium]